MSVLSLVLRSVGSELVCVSVDIVCVLACGFGILGTLKMTGRGGTHTDTRLSSLSCLSAGVFLASCLLDIIPNFLTEMRETFTQLNVTSQFPVPELMVCVGFLLLMVMEQLILTLKDDSREKEGQEESVAPPPRSAPPLPDPARSNIRSSVLPLSLCLFFFLRGISVKEGQPRPRLLLRTSLLACGLAVLLTWSHARRTTVSVCLTMLSLAYPLGSALRHAHLPLRLARSVLQGLSAGSFVYIIFMDVMPRVMSANKHRIANITLVLTGFSLLTAALLLHI